MHPITSERISVGQYYTLMYRLRADQAKFFDYFRMSEGTFNELLNLIQPYIARQDTNMRKSITAEERLAITLRYLATGCSFKELNYNFRCGASTAREIVYDVCKKIWEYLGNICFPQLTESDWLKIAEEYEARANFPNCLGAIDGKHVRIVQPATSGSSYFNYKKYFSMVLLAVCDSNYKFIYIDTGSYGKASDSAVFSNCDLYRKMTENKLNIPKAKPILPDGDAFPFTFIGDEAFGLSIHMLRPYGGKNLSKQKKIFNYRLSRARRYIECSFGILTNKWRIFYRPLNVKVEKADMIIKACCCLHNFIRERESIDFDHTLQIIGLSEDRSPTVRTCERSAVTNREKLAQYFCSEAGRVPWQDNSI